MPDRLSAATAEVANRWRAYAEGRNIRTPAVRQVAAFLQVEYGIEWSDNLVARLVGGSDAAAQVDMSSVIPRLADMLLDSGVLRVERP